MGTRQLSVEMRSTGLPRQNVSDLVIISVSGRIVHPVDKRSPYRIGQDGIPRVLPGSGGIVTNFRIGDRCVGLAGDHIEPGVSIKNEQRAFKGEKDGYNLALNTYACIGNLAILLTGPCKGRKGVVTGKHGGVNHVLLDFPSRVLQTLHIGDRIQIHAHGTGLKFPDYPDIQIYNCSPRLIQRWGLRAHPKRIRIPVTHLIPAGIMGSGIGRNNAVRGDYDIQLFDPEVRAQLHLNSLRFGDFVAIIHGDSRYGRTFHKDFITIGIIVHSDSTVSGHGPGVVTLLTGPAQRLEPVRDSRANLAQVLGLRELGRPRPYRTLLEKKIERGGGGKRTFIKEGITESRR